MKKRSQQNVKQKEFTSQKSRIQKLKMCNLHKSNICRTNIMANVFPNYIVKTSNVTTITKDRSASFGLAFHAQHIFLQIILIFSSPEGYRLQFSIPRAYFVYTVWHCTGQHCSSMYVCTYRLFAGTWRPLVSVITTLYHVVIIFYRRVWYRALSLRYACIRSSGIILIP